MSLRSRSRIGLLIANLLGNAMALYGSAGYLADGSRLPLIIAGGLITVVCIVALSKPS